MENENIELTEMEPSARRSTGPHRCHHHHLSSNDVYFSSHRPKPTTQCLSATTVATGSMQVMDPLERHTRFGIQSPLPPATPQVSRHYRLTKTSTTSNNHWEAVIDLMSQSILNRFILTYVHWTFQTSIVWVLASLTVVFWAIIILYAVCIWAVGMTHPECIYVKDLDFKEAGNYFMDALTISWTTFSSVGYGAAGPALSNTKRCILLNMFTALEAFGGVLFASFAGALLFGAISRMSCVAKVVWSEPMVVKYGAGVEGANVAAENDVAWSHVSQPLPCPVLEFRVANLYHNRIGGEIVDARIGIWASTRAEQAEEAILQATGFSFNLKRRGKKKRWGNRRHQKLGHTVMHSDQGPKEQSVPIPTIVERDPMTIEEAKEDGRSEILKQLAQCSLSQTHLSVTEDPSNQLVPSMIFSKLNVETDKHPLFQRVWLIRHRLDASSPLLDKKAHEMIEANNGNWPASLNSHAAVRRHLHFQELMVSLYGTDNVTARSVIANKVYPYAAVRIGYRFAETLVGCPVTGHLHVNLDAMHDVVEQKGGGGEALPRSIHEP